MGRKVLSIWLAVLLLLTGCSQQNTAGESTATVTPTEEPAVVSVDWSEEKVYSAPVENEEYFFYAAKKGIVRIDKKTGERKKIVSKGEIEFICLAEDGLYYSDGFYLYSCGFSGENAKEIFYSREIKGVDEQYIELWDMQIHEGKTYFLIAGLEMVQIDIESKTAEQIGWDVRSGCFWGDSFYYRRRSSEEIYKVNLETKKEEVVRDQHIRKDEREGKDVKVVYDAVFTFQDNLYYTCHLQNSEENYDYRTYRYSEEGDDECVMKVALVNPLSGQEDALYETFWEEDKDYLYRYDIEKGTQSKMPLPEDFFDAVSILDNTLFYRAEDPEDDEDELPYYKTLPLNFDVSEK